MISILILTRNEEANLAACLESVKWSDDIVVFDSFSTDQTVKIARAAGARVIQRAFDNERNHRTASLRAPFKHSWVYNPDADEITPSELRDEILSVTADSDRPEVAYRVRFKTMCGGRWIRHSSLYPTWVVRLFRPEKISFERSVNLRYIVHGPEGRLRNHFEHHTFNKGIEAWIEKHNRYSSQEAIESLKSLSLREHAWMHLFSSSPVLRRRALKEISFHLPFRPTFRFFYMYFFRWGFLDGRPGLDYCLLLSMYERMIVLKMNEIHQLQQSIVSATAKTSLKRTRCRFSWRQALVFLAGALAVLYLAASVFAKNLLCIESGLRHADVVIVLGGESTERARQTLELFKEGAAPRIIVSGDGDTAVLAQLLTQAGVPPDDIEMENHSRNTMENAEFTVQLLKKSGVHRAIIVTSWFHSRRALNSFCFFAPEIQFTSVPAGQGQAWTSETTHVFQEYLKTVWYYFRYGISPWRCSAS